MSSRSPCFHLFVYGTLRSQCTNPDALMLHRRATLIGGGRVRGHLQRFKRYRGIRLELNAGKWVPGEIYRLKELAILTILDRYEGSDYERVQVRVKRGGGYLMCWIYQLGNTKI